MEEGERERGMPRSLFLYILGFCDLDELAKMEMVSTSWNSLVQSLESSTLWQRCVHRALGRQKIERYKVALGLKSGQSYHQEGSDLQARNWKRILRLNVSEKLLPNNPKGMRATVLHDHEGPVISMCGGGPYLFTGGGDRRIFMYRIPTFLSYTLESAEKKAPAPIRSFGADHAQPGPILCMAAMRDFVVAGGLDCKARLWKIDSSPGSPAHREYAGHSGPIWSIALTSPDDSDQVHLITGSVDTTINIWDLWGPQGALPLLRLEGHYSGVAALHVLQQERVVISGGDDGTVRMWSIEDGRCTLSLEGESEKFNNVQSCQIDRGRDTFIAVYASDTRGKIWMWDYGTGEVVQAVTAHDAAVTGLSMSLSPEYSLISTSMDGTIKLWKPETLTCQKSLSITDILYNHPRSAGHERSQPEKVHPSKSHAWGNILFISTWNASVLACVFSE